MFLVIVQQRIMGAQQVKERSSGERSLGAGTSIRSSRMKPRVPKDGRQIGSNIFTEHNGEHWKH